MKATRATWLVAHKLRFFQTREGMKEWFAPVKIPAADIILLSTLPFILS